ncbi:NAD-dependent epimerase/dehydratase family protein [Pseudalkalibacillus sp. Hm43]|uniref:NAD-dependent epimerase/dehydratase family protein n=1 Tax=Pseudalkalibacillus sp. Hm43 TaxID=3450742 RepID=UPI003F438C2B
MMKTLVMGGTEFVSEAVAKQLISEGHEVDILTRGNRNPIYEGVHEHHICDRKEGHQLFEKLNDIQYDYVFDVTAYTQEDVKILTNVLNKEKLKGYVFCSSGAVYPQSDGHVQEEMATGNNPSWSQYGKDKFEAENYLMELYHAEEFPAVIFRPPYIYGEGNNIYREAFLFDRIQSDEPIPYPGDGTTKVQFIHIEDLVKGFSSTINLDSSVGQIYNLSFPEDITWIEYIKTGMEVVGNNAPLVQVSHDWMDQNGMSFKDFFPYKDETFLMSVDKLHQSGLHVPSINLKEGLERAYQWYVTQQNKPDFRKMKSIDKVVRLCDSGI